ncbi:hypothetical protein [Streptomyces sp. H34-S4]|uniref:hypothetical protein n=1 Tax=Streptomyces sp. H34-S4 TaxID=2996463 RepID=UPI002270311A|nr:hypothetical protein [Streptomyces sp. H34-S4]MCY0939604.1 hypothetical protein [Streptomyces sp. H34-S4]
MPDDDPSYTQTLKMLVDRSIFGIEETQSSPELPYLRWAEMEMDSTPVRIGQGAIRFMSLAGTHYPLITIEVRSKPREPKGSGFELIGQGSYRSASGEASLFNIDGPELDFKLTPDSEYDLRVWRCGGDAASQRYATLLGKVYPIEGIEEYLIQFIQK